MKNSLVRASLLALAALWGGLAQAAVEVSRDILDDGNTVQLFNPAVAVDSQGNYHIAAQGNTPGSTDNNSTTEIYYLRVSPAGAVLTPRVRVNTADASGEGRARIVTTSNNKAVVVWRGTSTEATRAALINPALAPASVVEIGETTVGVSTSSHGHMAVAIDSADKVHVVVARANGTDMTHVRFTAATLVPDVVEHAIKAGMRTYYRQPEIGLAIDGDDALHLLFNSNNFDKGVAYVMLNNSGGVLIDETALFDRAGVYAPSAHASIMVGGNGDVHAVWGDKRDTLEHDSVCNRCELGGSTFYMRLRPSDDDQSGDAAVLANIRVGDEVRVGNVWYPKAFMDSGGGVHVIAGGALHGNGDFSHFSVSGGGASERRIQAQLSTPSLSKPYAVGAGKRVVWAESVYSPTLTGATNQLVMASASSLGGGGGGGGGSPAPVLLLILGAALLARAGIRRA